MHLETKWQICVPANMYVKQILFSSFFPIFELEVPMCNKTLNSWLTGIVSAFCFHLALNAPLSFAS